MINLTISHIKCTADISYYYEKCESESRSVVSDSFVIPWTIQSMEFSRPEYWSGQPFPSPGDLPNPGIKPRSPVLQVDSLPPEPQGQPKNTSEQPIPLQADLPDSGIELGSPILQADTLPPELSGKPKTRILSEVRYESMPPEETVT